jgi:hypothetical protein
MIARVSNTRTQTTTPRYRADDNVKLFFEKEVETPSPGLCIKKMHTFIIISFNEGLTRAYIKQPEAIIPHLQTCQWGKTWLAWAIESSMVQQHTGRCRGVVTASHPSASWLRTENDPDHSGIRTSRWRAKNTGNRTRTQAGKAPQSESQHTSAEISHEIQTR